MTQDNPKADTCPRCGASPLNKECRTNACVLVGQIETDDLDALFDKHQVMFAGREKVSPEERKKRLATDIRRYSHHQTEQAVLEATARIDADLAWCLGKLRGLGHPADAIENRLDERLRKGAA